MSNAYTLLHEFLQKEEQQIYAILQKICEIPSHTFHEEEKINYLLEELQEFGLYDVRIDETGNAVGMITSSPDNDKYVLISAHADTACEAPQPIRVTEKDGCFFAHGICDNTAGVTAVLTLLHFLKHQNAKLTHNYCIAFTVDEEGLGAKRGMKGLIQEREKDIEYVINVESHNIGRLTNSCVGQVRGRLSLNAKQEGAHSWRNFGEPNAVVALSQIINAFSLDPLSPQSSFNVTAIKGGENINAIPSEAECLFEFRSASQDDLNTLLKRWQSTIARFCTEKLTGNCKILSTTAAASIPEDHQLFTIAANEQKALGITPYYKTGNTDGDIPLAHGIPTITLGSSNGNATHSLEEYMEKDTYLLGVEQIIRIILSIDEKIDISEYR